MYSTLVLLLAAGFFFSVLGLFAFVWSLSTGLFSLEQASARVIFAEGEAGYVEDPAASAAEKRELQAASHGGLHEDRPAALREQEARERTELDQSSRLASFAFVSSAIFWLIIGSVFGLAASYKLHNPDWLTAFPGLTFGRIRPAHLNVVGYGWVAMAVFGVAMFMLPRLLKTPLVGAGYAVMGATIWNLALYSGILAVLFGWTNGLEWLEFPWPVGILFVIGGACTAVPLLLTLMRRKVDHLYVSVWYSGAALLWFPFLYLVANAPYVHFGVESAMMNWWYGHNVLGYFMTPAAVGAIYYFVPKVIGEPIHSYNISVIGFWSLALFYGQAGMHHLTGGPVPSWVVSLSTVMSMMMVLPVVAFIINFWNTMKGHWRTSVISPTMRFMAFGGVCYVLASFQGSQEAWRSMSTVVHFTHYTVAHAHIGLYGFVTFVMFGAIYFMMPRVLEWEWPFPKLITLHFWLSASGIMIYFFGLSVGGWLQGMAMLDEHRPFMDSVLLTLPYLKARTVGGALMTLGHLVFAFHFYVMVLRHGPERSVAAVIGWKRLRA